MDLDAYSNNIKADSMDRQEHAYQSLYGSFGMYIGSPGSHAALSYEIIEYLSKPDLLQFSVRTKKARRAILKIFNDGELVRTLVCSINIPLTLLHHTLLYMLPDFEKVEIY